MSVTATPRYMPTVPSAGAPSESSFNAVRILRYCQIPRWRAQSLKLLTLTSDTSSVSQDAFHDSNIQSGSQYPPPDLIHLFYASSKGNIF